VLLFVIPYGGTPDGLLGRQFPLASRPFVEQQSIPWAVVLGCPSGVHEDEF
jgi:hypothetical protein